MDSKVTVFEVQNNYYSVKQYEVAPKYPRVSKSHLYIVTNQNTQLHLLNKEGGNIEKSIFQHGVSTKVLTITNATRTGCEVRMLLSPSEISRLALNFNFMGFVKSCLMVKKYQNSLSSLCAPKKNHKVNVQELCRAAAQFLSSSEDNIVNDYCKKFNEILTETFRASCIGQKIGNMVLGPLVALVAAELATSVGGIRSLDYRVEKEKTQEDQKEQIKKMMNVFDVMVDLLTVTHQGKRVQIIFRNPCPDNWALGGKKPVHSEETFVFGLCHKVVSISEAESKVQFLQNLQESYDIISVFHLPAYVENLLMTSEWRNKIELFLKKQDERKKIIHELSSLALMFICSKSCPEKTFMKVFKRDMLEKWSKVEAFIVSDEVVCSFGILVAILAAVTAKSIVDGPIPDSEEEVEEELLDPIASSAPSSAGSLSTSLDKSSNSAVDLMKAKLESGEVGIHDDKTRISGINDQGMTDQGSPNGSLKKDEPVVDLPGVGTLDIADQESDNNENIDKENPEKPIAKLVDSIESSAPSSDGSSSTFLDDSLKIIIIPKVTVEYEGAKPECDRGSGDLVKVELKRGEVDICDAKSKTDSTNDPGTTDQGSIDGSLKNDGPVAELPGLGTLDITDQEANNSNDNDKEDPEKPVEKLVDPIASSAPSSDGSSNTFFFDGLKVIVPEETNEFGEAKIDSDSSLGDWVKVDLESCVMGICDAKSKIGITNDPEMTDQGSLDGSPITGEHLSVFPRGGTLGIEEADEGDNANKEDREKPAGKLVDSIKSCVSSSVGSTGTFLHNSLNSFEVISTRETEEYGGTKPDLESSSGDWVKAELESGEESTCDAKSKIGSIHDPGMNDQGSIDGSLKGYDALADLPRVGPEGIADQDEDNGEDGDANSHRQTEATKYEYGPTSPEVEGAIHSHGSGDGRPSLDDSNDDGIYRVAQPPSVEARNNALEAQNSPFRNRILKTGFMGLMCFLVVATLTNMLPQSARPVPVAIILGLLVVKWLASRQP